MREPPYFRPETLEIVIPVPGHKGYEYPIDLERCKTSAQFLDWILQIHSKNWCDAELLKALLDCFETTCESVFGQTLQGVFCPFGQNQIVNWREAVYA